MAMTKQGQPTLRGRWLGGRLRELREACELRIAEVADYLGKNQGTISRFETGIYPIQGDHLLRLLDLYQVSEMAQRTELLQLAESVTQRGWWGGYEKYLGQPFADFVWMENLAEAIDVLEMNSLPGLLQTRAYATTLIGNGPQRDDDHTVNRLVEARVARSQVLEKENAVTIRLLVYEAIVWQDVGGSEVMANQLGHVLDTMERDNVELRILPISSWEHAAQAVGAGFNYFRLPDGYPEVVCVETPAGPVYQESPDVDSFVASYDALWRAALNPQESTARITTRMKDLG